MGCEGLCLPLQAQKFENERAALALKIFFDKDMIVLAIQNATLAVVALLTGVGLVAVALWLAGLLAPRSFNPQKGEPYECGIPTRGESMAQFKVGYYLFAILFLMFDVETLFLYPWAVVVKDFGSAALLSIGFFLLVLVFGLAYAWRKGALEWK